MKFDASMPPISIKDVPKLAREAERFGFDALWSMETQHDPFLSLGLVAEHTNELQFGTGVAIGFARSPATLAYTSWDLAEASGGRFILGMGTQVRAHIERRFGMPWPNSPVGKLRELVGAVRAFWSAWQSGERLSYQGEYYRLSLMTPFFNPGPIRHPEIPIYIAGVNTGLARLAGEVADGFFAHPYHSVSYIKEVILSAIREGAKRGNRDAKAVKINMTAFVVSDPGEEAFIRSQIAFYASTPSYRPVMAHHGWGEVADKLRELSRQRQWGEMASLISDDMLKTFAVVASPSEVAPALKERYDGLADRLAIYMPFIPGLKDGFWHEVVDGMREAA